METDFLTSLEIKSHLSRIYEDSVLSVCKIIDKIGSKSYSANGYWMSSEVSFTLDGNCIGPNLILLKDGNKSVQVKKIGKYRNGSGSKFELRLYFDYTNYTILPIKMAAREFPYVTVDDYIPTITILSSLEYIVSNLADKL